MPADGHYTGPFNRIGERPVSKLDWVSARHDRGYAAIDVAFPQTNPYLPSMSYYHPSHADETWLRRTKSVRPKTIRAKAALLSGRAFFTVKQKFPFSRLPRLPLAVSQKEPLKKSVDMGKRTRASRSSQKANKRARKEARLVRRTARRRKRAVKKNASRAVVVSRRTPNRFKMNSKALTKRVKKIMKTEYFEGPWTTRTSYAGQHTSDINEVAWNVISSGMSKISGIQNVILGDDGPKWIGVDDIGDSRIEQPQGLTGALTGLTGMKYRLSRTFEYVFRNNTNFPVALCAYVFKCTDYTLNSPVTDLDVAYQAGIKDSVPGSFRDDPFQYWTVPHVSASKRKWKIHSKQEIFLEGGHMAPMKIKMPNFTYNTDLIVENTGFTSSFYTKGSYVLVFRQMGVPAHDKTDSTIMGMSNTVLDQFHREFTSVSVKKGLAIRQETMDEHSGFSLAEAVVGDEELVGVGVLNKGP